MQKGLGLSISIVQRLTLRQNSVEQAELGVPHSEIQVELNLQLTILA